MIQPAQPPLSLRERLIDEAVRTEFSRFDGTASIGFQGCVEWARWCEADGERTIQSFARGCTYRVQEIFRHLCGCEICKPSVPRYQHPTAREYADGSWPKDQWTDEFNRATA